MKDNEITQIIEEIFEVNICEKKIKEEIIKLNQNGINYQKYVLLNKNWIEKYKKCYNYEQFIKTQQINFPSNIENIFNKVNLIPEFDISPLDLKNEIKNNLNFPLPRNYVLVSVKFIKLIMKHFENSNSKRNNIKLTFDSLIYDVIIWGKCIIISDRHNKISYFIILFRESDNNNKDNCYYNYNTDSIDFILRFEEKIKLKQNLILFYLMAFPIIQKREIQVHKSVEKIINSKNELIGYFFNILFFDGIKSTNVGLYYFGPKSKNNIRNDITFNSKTFYVRGKTTKEIKEIIDLLLNSFLIGLYQIERIKRIFNKFDKKNIQKPLMYFMNFLIILP